MPERKKRSRADEAKSSAAPSKTSYRVQLDDALLAELRQWPKGDRKRIGDTIRRVQENFGRPHLHSGVGIRDLSPKGKRLGVSRIVSIKTLPVSSNSGLNARKRSIEKNSD